ncbi:hypothetical protein K2X89_04335 [Myxococcota bacterium]|nr:hypothetical protein [Myxococcota bacterium]
MVRRVVLFLWYACQACLGLAVIGLSAVSQGADAERITDMNRNPQARMDGHRAPRSVPSPGPSLP